MQWLNKNYKLGKFSQGDGRFVGKEIKMQEDGGILIHQPLYTKEKVKGRAGSSPYATRRRSHNFEDFWDHLHG